MILNSRITLLYIKLFRLKYKFGTYVALGQKHRPKVQHM